MACSHCRHSDDLISKPGTPGVMCASLILAWHLVQRGCAIAASGGVFDIDTSVMLATYAVPDRLPPDSRTSIVPRGKCPRQDREGKVNSGDAKPLRSSRVLRHNLPWQISHRNAI